jgi:hypothetical protein
LTGECQYFGETPKKSAPSKRIVFEVQSNEKMDMFRHDYVTDDHKLMTLADLLHNFEEEIALPGRPTSLTQPTVWCRLVAA